MFKILALTPVIFVSGMLFFTAVALKVYYNGLKCKFARDLDDIEKTRDVFKVKEAELAGQLKKIDREVSGIASLYEITKAMSVSLFFDEIFGIFSEFLKKNFRFISCRLILKSRDKAKGGEEKAYRIEGAGLPGQDLVNKEIPMISQGEIIGVLNIEGLQKAAIEKFMIVAKQFSLETEKARLYEAVQELAITDGLTGVFVRRHFLEKAKEELERSSRHHFKTSFLMIDLDYFKELNDEFGHLTGDAVLKDVARVLKQNMREIDLAGRYGGEEFLFLLPETDKAAAAVVAERLRAAVAKQEFMAYDEILKATISAGISTFPDDSKDINELIEFADKALYRAKAEGRNRVSMFTGG